VLVAALIMVHLVLGLALLGLVAAIILVAGPRAIRGGQPPPLYRPLHRAAAALVVVEFVIGLLLYIQQQRPHSTVHLVYAAAALAVMPLAQALVRRDRSRARLYQLGGTILLLGVVLRLVTTG
jgi:drug/metabolite transporter (DMT)-like permease